MRAVRMPGYRRILLPRRSSRASGALARRRARVYGGRHTEAHGGPTRMTATDTRTKSGSPTALDAEAVKGLAQRLRGQLIAPGDADYDAARALYNGMID